MISLLVSLALVGQFDMGRGSRLCASRDRSGLRSVFCSGREAIEFAPDDGAGMGNECACAAVTTTSGLAVPVTRASSATCVTSAGVGYTCTNDQPVVERRGGILGLRVEPAATNRILRSEELDNASWTATATVTANTYAGPWGTLMEQLSDGSGAASQGVQQTYTAGWGTDQYWMFSCWVRSGSATAVRLKLTGVGASAGDATCTLTGLTSTPQRYACVSGNYTDYATATAMTVDVLVGSADADTGTIGVGHCQLERHVNGANKKVTASSYIKTEGSTVIRSSASAAIALNPNPINNSVGCFMYSHYIEKFTDGWGPPDFNPTKTAAPTASYMYLSSSNPAVDGWMAVSVGVGGVNISQSRSNRFDRWATARLTWNQPGNVLCIYSHTVAEGWAGCAGAATTTYAGGVGFAASTSTTLAANYGLVSRFKVGTSSAGCNL